MTETTTGLRERREMLIKQVETYRTEYSALGKKLRAAEKEINSINFLLAERQNVPANKGG